MAIALVRVLLPLAALAGCSPSSSATNTQSEAATAETRTDQALLGKSEASLIARDGSCFLRRSGQTEIRLAPAAPCRFLRADNVVQQYAYPRRGIDAVVLVIGSRADASRKKHFGISATTECGTVAQGLIVRGQAVEPARQSRSGGMYCVNSGRDEKDFHAVAHDQ